MYQNFKSLTIEAFRQKFGTVQQCTDYISSTKWANGFKCKNCGNTRFCKGSGYGDRQCTKCKKIESAKSGTLFHRMKIPLNLSFYMMYLIVIDKKGCSSTNLARQTGLQQKTCWLFKVKVMQAMESTDRHPLEGDVDISHIIIEKNLIQEDGKRKGGKSRVFVAIEKKGGGAARVYALAMDRTSAKKTDAFIKRKIDKCAILNLDAETQYCLTGSPALENKNYDKKLATRVTRNMTDWLRSRHGNVVYLQFYINEYCYRHNRHRMTGEILDDLVDRMINHEPRPYKMIVSLR